MLEPGTLVKIQPTKKHWAFLMDDNGRIIGTVSGEDCEIGIMIGCHVTCKSLYNVLTKRGACHVWDDDIEIIQYV